MDRQGAKTPGMEPEAKLDAATRWVIAAGQQRELLIKFDVALLKHGIRRVVL
jgi:hypothetical protein